jgi:DNA-binding MarR family transcriptional regulator
MGILRKRPGSTLSALSAQLALTLSATSRLVDALVAKGLVARSTPAANRRTLALHLTPVGARAHARAYNHAQHELALLLQRLPLNTRTTLTRSMHALRQALQPAA